jgi:ElaB/YqjD/DUF883 family membrane-anchored ribosome-binding protein
MAEKGTLTENREQVEIHNWAPVNESGKPKSSSEIEHDIEETRDEMNRLLDALADRISPNRMVNRFRGKIIRAYKHNKLPLLLMASGAAWMFWDIQHQDGKGRPEYYRRRERPEEEVRHKVESGMQRARQEGEQYEQRARETSEEVKERAKEGVESTKEKVSYYSEQAKERSQEMLRRTDRAVHENPLLAGLTAAVAGVITGLLLPVTETEKKSVGKNVRETFEQAKEKGKETLERGKEVLSAAKEESEKQGLPEDISRADQPERRGKVSSKISETVKAATEKAEEKMGKNYPGKKAA